MGVINDPDGFIIAYFGDFRDGETDEEIITKAISENDKSYIQEIINLLNNLLVKEKNYKNYLNKQNVYVSDDEKGKIWLENLISKLLAGLQSKQINSN